MPTPHKGVGIVFCNGLILWQILCFISYIEVSGLVCSCCSKRWIPKMGRLSRKDEIKRRNKMRKMMDEGYDHNQIADALNMRPQNALAMMKRLDVIPDEEIVTPSQQRETLNDLTERLCLDLNDIDDFLEKLKEDPVNNRVGLEKFYKLKLEICTTVADFWAITQSIVASKQSISSISGDKVQVNIDKIDYKKLDDAARKAAKVLDEARLVPDEDRGS